MTRQIASSHRAFLRLLGGMIAVVLLLAACGTQPTGSTQPTSGTSADSGSTTAPTAAQSAPSGVTLTIWHNAADPKPFIDVFQRWADKSGNTVNLVAIPADGFENQIQTRWAAGERPDILEYHSTGFQIFNPAQNLQDLSGEDFVSKAPTLYPTLATVDGKTYAAITSFPTVFGLYFNKQVLADAGLEPPQTFDDLTDICTTLKEQAPDVVPIWESGGSLWPLQVLPAMYLADQGPSYEQSLLNRETTADDPNGPFVASLVAYENLMKSGCFNTDITTAKFEDGVKAVAEGRAAMTALHSGMVPMFNEALGGDTAKTDSTVGFAGPSLKGAHAWWAPSPTGTYYAPKTGDAAREAAALDFIRYATGEGYQQTIDESQTFPVLEGFTNPSSAQGLTLDIKKAFDTDSGLPWNVSFPPGIQFDQLMGTLISGQASPLEVAKQYQLQLAQGAKTQKLPGWE